MYFSKKCCSIFILHKKCFLDSPTLSDGKVTRPTGKFTECHTSDGDKLPNSRSILGKDVHFCERHINSFPDYKSH